MTVKQKAINKLVSIGWTELDAIEGMNAIRVAAQAYEKQQRACLALVDNNWSHRKILEALEDAPG